MDGRRVFTRDDSHRKFDGKVYQYGGVYASEERANTLARKLRSQGRSARVVAKQYFGDRKSYFLYWRLRRRSRR